MVLKFNTKLTYHRIENLSPHLYYCNRKPLIFKDGQQIHANPRLILHPKPSMCWYNISALLQYTYMTPEDSGIPNKHRTFFRRSRVPSSAVTTTTQVRSSGRNWLKHCLRTKPARTSNLVSQNREHRTEVSASSSL